MNVYQRVARQLVKHHGRTKAKVLINKKIKKLNSKMLKARSIDEGLDISNDIANEESILNFINKDHVSKQD